MIARNVDIDAERDGAGDGRATKKEYEASDSLVWKESCQ
jgi:hypothetical protein